MSKFFTSPIICKQPETKTVSEWLIQYDEILTTRPFGAKTLANRRNYIKYLKEGFGDALITDIKPHHVAQLVRAIYKERPHAARRVLIEAKDCFSEAVAYGWINTNPAAAIKHMIAKVVRKRLSLDDWKSTYEYAQKNLPPWIHRMLLLALVTGQRRGDLQKMKFSDVSDGYLHIKQQKTGMLIRLPLALRLNVIGVSVGEAIELCKDYAPEGDNLLRKSTGKPLTLASLSARFETARECAFGKYVGEGDPPSLHECRSLAERLYRQQGINTQTLLGHKHQRMTDLYNDDRGLEAGVWKTLEIS